MTTRQNKVAKQIQKDISDIIQMHAREFISGKMLTVTTVRISSDLSIARIYISVYPSSNSAETILLLNNHLGFFKNELGKKIRHQVKKIPEISFYLDDTLDYIENIDNLLKK
jgi:ribosome-binding factor A